MDLPLSDFCRIAKVAVDSMSYQSKYMLRLRAHQAHEIVARDIKATKLRDDMNFVGLSHAGTDTIHVCSTVGCASKYAECECVTPAMTETTRVDNTHISSLCQEKHGT